MLLDLVASGIGALRENRRSDVPGRRGYCVKPTRTRGDADAATLFPSPRVLAVPTLALVTRTRGAAGRAPGPDAEQRARRPAQLVRAGPIRVEPGDTVTFVPTDKGHNSASVVIPDGAEPWNGKLSQEIAVTLTVPGLYAYKCLPHFGLGMVGLIAVGDPSINLDAVAAGKHPGKAKTVVTRPAARGQVHRLTRR